MSQRKGKRLIELVISANGSPRSTIERTSFNHATIAILIFKRRNKNLMNINGINNLLIKGGRISDKGSIKHFKQLYKELTDLGIKVELKGCTMLAQKLYID